MENNPMYHEDEISLEELILPLKKRWKMILSFSVIVAAVAAICSLFLPRVYEAKNYIRIGADGGRVFESVEQINTIMTSRPTLVNIAKELKIEPTKKNISELKSKIKYLNRTGFLEIKVEDLSSESAIKTVNIVSKMILKRHENFYDLAQKNILSTVKIIREFVKPIPLSTGTSEFKVTPTVIVVEAFSDGVPVKPKRKQIVIIAFTIGALISVLYSYWLERKKPSQS